MKTAMASESKRSKKKCPHCGGKGYFLQLRWGESKVQPFKCTSCNGKGFEHKINKQ